MKNMRNPTAGRYADMLDVGGIVRAASAANAAGGAEHPVTLFEFVEFAHNVQEQLDMLQEDGVPHVGTVNPFVWEYFTQPNKNKPQVKVTTANEVIKDSRIDWDTPRIMTWDEGKHLSYRTKNGDDSALPHGFKVGKNQRVDTVRPFRLTP